ncbi:MAG: HlyD family secretion protein [Planctomycetes bacterium]|nr:HlyD family secretion protein [Planctomycetota bacterium]
MIREFGSDPSDPTKNIDYGTVVCKGTVLARIDDAPYRAAVSRARAQVEHSEAAVQQAGAQVTQALANAERAEADIEQLNAKLDLAARDFDRISRLVTKSTLTASDHDTARASLASAKAALAVGKATLGQTKAAIDDAKANEVKMRAALSDSKVALETAEINLGYCTITSPVDGSIIDRRVNVGQTVVASLNAPSLFLIAKDLQKVQVWTSVNEADIGKVRKGQKVDFRVDAYPNRVFQGKVAQIRLNAMMTQNVVTYTVVVTADNSDGLLPYLTANVEIEVDCREGVLTVPNGALRWQPERDQIVAEFRETTQTESTTAGIPNEGIVWVADGGLVRPVKITIGVSDGSRTEIHGDGISANTPVVIGLDRAENAARSGNPFIPQIPGKKKKS